MTKYFLLLICIMVFTSVAPNPKVDFWDCAAPFLDERQTTSLPIEVVLSDNSLVYSIDKNTVDQELLYWFDDIDLANLDEYRFSLKGAEYSILVAKYRLATGLGINFFGWLIYHHQTRSYCIVDSLSDDVRMLSYNENLDCFEICNIDYSDEFLDNRNEHSIAYDVLAALWKPLMDENVITLKSNCKCG